MTGLLTYELSDSIATITLDDGRVNVLSPQMLADINAALDQAEADDAVVVLGGRSGVFSAGFDLKILRAGGEEALDMLRAGFELAARVLAFPRPVVIACSGHAIAMGVFLVLSGDYRVGVAGPYKLTANEVAIGLTMPRTAAEILRQRLAPAHFNRAAVIAEVYDPDTAVAAGFLDRVVGSADLAGAARDVARQVQALDRDAHAATKLRVRNKALAAVRVAIDLDYGDAARQALRAQAS